MANFKRKKSRRNVRCTMCTDGREGNSQKSGTSRNPKVALEKQTKAVRRRQAEKDAYLDDVNIDG